MIFRQLFQEFANYSKTPEYLHGMMVAITQIFLEIALLSIIVPVILYIIKRIQTRHLRATVDFFVFQVLHKITRMFLNMGAVDNIWSILEEEKKQNPKFEIYSHHLYGNLENILFVLRKILEKKESLRNELERKSLDDFLRYMVTAEKCMDEIDHLVMMFLALPQVHEDLFRMRSIVYPLRDIIQDIIEDMRKSDSEPFMRNSYTADLINYIEVLTNIIDEIFLKRKKLIDSMLKHQQIQWVLKLLFTVLFVVLWRKIDILACRLQRKPYRDPIAPTLIPEMLLDWRIKHAFKIEEAAMALGISTYEYRDYENGYRTPDINTWEPLKKHMRGEVDYSFFPKRK